MQTYFEVYAMDEFTESPTVRAATKYFYSQKVKQLLTYKSNLRLSPKTTRVIAKLKQ